MSTEHVMRRVPTEARVRAVRQALHGRTGAEYLWEAALTRGIVTPEFYDPEVREVVSHPPETSHGDVIRALCADPAAVLSVEAQIAELIQQRTATPRPVRFLWSVVSRGTTFASVLPLYPKFVDRCHVPKARGSMYPVYTDSVDLHRESRSRRMMLMQENGTELDHARRPYRNILRQGFLWENVELCNARHETASGDYPESWRNCYVATVYCPKLSANPAGVFANRSLSDLVEINTIAWEDLRDCGLRTFTDLWTERGARAVLHNLPERTRSCLRILLRSLGLTLPDATSLDLPSASM